MGIFKIHGLIDRRVLVNFTVDPDIVQKIIPSPFRPKVYKGKAVVGICLIRLKHIRPKGLPGFVGIGSENGAHRKAKDIYLFRAQIAALVIRVNFHLILR